MAFLVMTVTTTESAGAVVVVEVVVVGIGKMLQLAQMNPWRNFMDEHHGVVEAANGLEEGLAFGGAEHRLAVDNVSNIVTVLKDKLVTGIVRELGCTLKQCWRAWACDNIAGREEVTFLPFRQQSALLGDCIVAEEVTAAGATADLLADCNALIRVLVLLARNRLRANDLLSRRAALPNAEVAAVSSKDCCQLEQKYVEKRNPHCGKVGTS